MIDVGRIDRQRKTRNTLGDAAQGKRKKMQKQIGIGHFPAGGCVGFFSLVVPAALSLSLSPFHLSPSFSLTSMADERMRRASAHVERDCGGFDLAGMRNIGGGGSSAGGTGSNVAERRRSTSFLSSGTLHAPEVHVNEEDNELFMSDEFRMYCYKVRCGLFFLSCFRVLVAECRRRLRAFRFVIFFPTLRAFS